MRALILWCIVVAVAFAPYALQAAEEVGPAFNDGTWVCGEPKHVVTREKVVVPQFVRQLCWREISGGKEKAAILRYRGADGEVVLKGWGLLEAADGTDDFKDAYIALRLADGTWALGERGVNDYAFVFSKDAVTDELLSITIRIRVGGDEKAEREFWFGKLVDGLPAA